MTTGEKIAALRRANSLTQEQLAGTLSVSRQSVSRWERDAALPDVEKLLVLSRLLGCSVDFLLDSGSSDLSDKACPAGRPDVSPLDCMRFIRECGYFFLATCVDEQPHLRPMGMVWADEHALYIATDRRKSVWSELTANGRIEAASYNLNTRRWLRLRGTAGEERSAHIRAQMQLAYPMISQEYTGENEAALAIFRITPDYASID